VSTATLEGICLNGGQSLVEVSSSERFGLYLHPDSQPPVNIAYEIENIRVQNHSVTVDGQQRLHVVEHLFSALYGLNLFDVRIDVYGNEIPFFDGSSREFGHAMASFDRGQSPSTTLHNGVEVREGDGFVRFTPMDIDDLTIEMSLVHPYIGVQSIALRITPETYREEIMSARTFVFTSEDDPRLHDMPPYGIGITAKRIYAADPLRFADEPVRHKVLDLLGDMYVLRRCPRGRITAMNTSHRLNLIFVRQMVRAIDGRHA
jgi:UDP-3-O-[3-hydroxymyristoyl] N-acetylglucosamine deacetylase